MGRLPKKPFQEPHQPGSSGSSRLSYQQSAALPAASVPPGHVRGSLEMAVERPTLIAGSGSAKPGRGSKRIVRPENGLVAWRSRKPVSIMKACVPFSCVTRARTYGVMPSE